MQCRYDRTAVIRSLFASDAGLLYLLQWQVVEALLPDERTEITHQLSERAASLIAPFGADRRQHYKDLKRLYGQRSALVHGRGCKFKQEHKEMAAYLRAILKAVLLDSNHKAAFAGKDENLRAYLLGLILGGV